MLQIRKIPIAASAIALSITIAPNAVLADGHTPERSGPLAPYHPYVYRTNVVVADMDRALRLYRDILDFEVQFIVPVEPNGILHETFKLDPGVKPRIAFLDTGKGQFGWEAKSVIGLSEVPGYEPPQQDMYNHAAIIEVNRDIQEFYDLIRAEGLETGRILELENPSRTELPFTDFDGHRIILMKLH